VDVENGQGGFAPIELATTDLRAAVDGADLVIVVSGGHTHRAGGRALSPLLSDGQRILLIQGNTGGSLIIRRELEQAGCRADVDVAEMDNYPFNFSWAEPTRVRLVERKHWLQIAAFPGQRTAAVFPKLSRIFPEAVAAPNILYTGLTNANAMVHVANCVANAAAIERGGRYKFYADGVTPAVIRLYEAIDTERLALAQALGVSVPSLLDWFGRAYGAREATLGEAIRRLVRDPDGPYLLTPSPKSLDHKFLSEDVPTGLMPMSALGSAVGVRTPAIDSLVGIVQYMTGRSFAGEARTLDRLGLSGMNPSQIQRVVREGFH
jgi:opine dehydrogenase